MAPLLTACSVRGDAIPRYHYYARLAGVAGIIAVPYQRMEDAERAVLARGRAGSRALAALMLPFTSFLPPSRGDVPYSPSVYHMSLRISRRFSRSHCLLDFATADGAVLCCRMRRSGWYSWVYCGSRSSTYPSWQAASCRAVHLLRCAAAVTAADMACLRQRFATNGGDLPHILQLRPGKLAEISRQPQPWAGATDWRGVVT